MLDQLSYNSKGTFLQNVHTIAILTYLAALLLLPLIFTHPLYLLGVFLVSILAKNIPSAANKRSAAKISQFRWVCHTSKPTTTAAPTRITLIINILLPALADI